MISEDKYQGLLPEYKNTLICTYIQKLLFEKVNL